MNAAAEKILRQLKAGDYAPVYVLQGEETYYIDLIAGYIETHALDATERSLNRIVLYGSDIDVPTLLTHARQFPMMGTRRVVIVKEAQQLRDLQRGNGAKLLLTYLARPTPSTVLVICHPHKTLDKRTTLAKKIDKMAISATFRPVFESQLPIFVRHYVQEAHCRIEEAAVHVLCEHVGNDLQRMVLEIDKVLLDLDRDAVATADRVMARVGISRTYNVFALQDALVERNTFKAYTIADYFHRNAKHMSIVPVVAFLYTFYSRLLAASMMPQSNTHALAAALHVSPFTVRHYGSALRRYARPHLIRNIHRLAKADAYLKGLYGNSLSEGEVLKDVVYRLVTDI